MEDARRDHGPLAPRYDPSFVLVAGFQGLKTCTKFKLVGRLCQFRSYTVVARGWVRPLQGNYERVGSGFRQNCMP
jgi:hypothetical protein